jgi:uncharacterized repeat protein (TIGR01451 family)
VTAGGTLHYQLHYTNTSPWGVQDVRIMDMLPTGTSLVSCSGGLTYSVQNRLVMCYLGAVTSQTHGTVEVVVRTSASLPVGTVLTNTGWITAPSRLNAVFAHHRAAIRAATAALSIPLIRKGP